MTRRLAVAAATLLILGCDSALGPKAGGNTEAPAAASDQPQPTVIRL